MKLYKFNIAVIAFAALAFVGCKHEDISKQHYDNKLFISATKFTDELLIKGSVTEASREITIGIAKPAAQNITAELSAAPELLDTYRKAYYDQEALLLEETYYSFSQTKVTISAGSVASAPVQINFTNVNQLDKEQRYVLPVTVRSVSGIGDVLRSARTFYFVFRGAALINVAADMKENRAWPEFKTGNPVTNMRTFTLEALVCGNAFKNQIATIMGIEGKFLIRLGDSGVAANQVQVASNNNLTNSNLQLDAFRWYHIAVTFDAGNVIVYLDGVNRCEGNVGTTSVNFGVEHSDESAGKDRCFWIGYSYDNERYLDGMISEVRIWNKVLTPEEINAADHFYQVEPASDGLVAYWKFDDGAGTTIKDYTSYGNNLTVEKAPKWTSVSLPQSNK